MCLAAVTCHLQLDRMIVCPYVTSMCLIILTSRPYVSSSLRHVHVSHHPYVTSMCLIILTSRSCVSSLLHVHVSHHPYVPFMCLIILTSRSCVSSSCYVTGKCLNILLCYFQVSENPVMLHPRVSVSRYVTVMCLIGILPLACLLMTLMDYL